MLFLAGAAGITSMQIGGRLADSLGARRVTLAALPVLIVGARSCSAWPRIYPIAVVGAHADRASATAPWTWP